MGRRSADKRAGGSQCQGARPRRAVRARKRWRNRALSGIVGASAPQASRETLMTADPLFDRAWSLIRVLREGPIAEVALNRPQARNALSAALMAELTEAATLLRRRADVLAVILTGEADYFSAGADLGGV